MKRLSISVLLLVFLFSSAQVFAEYDRTQVVKVMRNNVKMMRQLETAAENEDFFAMAEAFMELARGSNAIKDYDPKRGTQSTWKKTHLELIRAAFDGIGYCANEDIEAIWDVIADIGALNSQGHMAHKQLAGMRSAADPAQKGQLISNNGFVSLELFGHLTAAPECNDVDALFEVEIQVLMTRMGMK